MRTCPTCGEGFADDAERCPRDGAGLIGSSGGFPTTRTIVPEPGEMLGVYRLVEMLGEGGMGRVYVAEHTKLGRRVALKILRSELAGDRATLRRFFSEGQAVNRIRHENILEITDFVEEEGGRSYYVMELLEGETLRQAMSRGLLPIPRVLRVAAQVASALGAAHRAGIVHRDLKPGNVFLTERHGRGDFVKLLDFGVAKMSAPIGSTEEETDPGSLVGTLPYMSPEQLAGQRGDHRSDIYAFGLLLFELLVGRRALDGQSFPELMQRHRFEKPEAPSRSAGPQRGVPPALDALVLRCLKKTADARYQDMEEIEREIRALLGEEYVPPPPTVDAETVAHEAEPAPLGAHAADEPSTRSDFPRRFGPYLLLDTLGRGGMGEVYLAKSQGPAGIERLCVLKQVRADVGEEEENVRRFLDEGRVAVRLNHANICHTLEVGEIDRVFYIAMEHIFGVTLRALMRHPKLGGAMPRPLALYILSDVLEGLDYAHRLHDPITGKRTPIVHRDVSPHNVMVNYEGEVKIIDFGLAFSELKLEQTGSNVVLGKVAYMSPEQARGEPVDTRTDQYAAAILGYELFMGERFYPEELPQHTIWGLSGAGSYLPKRFSELPEVLQPLLRRSLSVRREERFESCGELRRALRAALRDEWPDDPKGLLRDFLQQLYAEQIARQAEVISSSARIELPPEPTSPRARGATPRAALLSEPSSSEIARAFYEGDLPPDGATGTMTMGAAGIGGGEETPHTSRAGASASDAVPLLARAAGARPLVLGAAALGVVALVVVAVLGLSKPAAKPDAKPLEPPPTPTTVELSFTSDPPGAAVVREGDEAPIGSTPLSVRFPRSGETAVFSLRLEGRPEVSRAVRLDRDQELAVVLPEVPVVSVPPPRRARPAETKREEEPKRSPRRIQRKDSVADPWAD